MVVFKYIEDKDVFQKFYSKMLAKRLVRISVNLACVALFRSIVYCNETSLHTSLTGAAHERQRRRRGVNDLQIEAG